MWEKIKDFLFLFLIRMKLNMNVNKKKNTLNSVIYYRIKQSFYEQKEIFTKKSFYSLIRFSFIWIVLF